MTFESNLSETRKGAIGEATVAARLILDSDGELSPYSPMADDRGVDLLAFHRATGIAVPLQIKSRTGTIKGKNYCHFQVRAATLDRNAMLLAVLLDLAQCDVEFVRAWLIPMRDIAQLAQQNNTRSSNYLRAVRRSFGCAIGRRVR